MRNYILSAFADESGAAVETQIAALKRNGIGMVELRMAGSGNVSYMTGDEAKELHETLEKAEIKVSSLGSPFGKIGIDEPFEPHFDAFRHALELCRILNTKYMRVFSFYMPEGADPAEKRGEVLRRLGLMLDAAEDSGIRLLHENEKGIYGDILARCVDLLDYFGGRLGCVFDPANFIQCGDKPSDNFAVLKDRIEYMHIKDALLADGSVVPAGKGDGSVGDILRMMPGEGDMILSVEPHLSVFSGLETLQTETVKRVYCYSDQNEAFDAACTALHDLLKEI